MSTSSTDSNGITTINRTFRVEFETPRTGYSIRVHREKIILDPNEIELAVVQHFFAFNEPIAKVASMQATQALMQQLGIQDPAILIEALATWFDALVIERQAELANGQ